jgi:membrane associated rhomboid family serine protease
LDFVNAPATYALIIANIAVTLYAFFVDRGFVNHFAFNVGAVTKRDQHYRVITSSFLHVDFFHLLFNMMTLYFFGPTVEKILGKLGFIVVYFGAIITSGIVSALVNRKNLSYSSVGASDAVSGVVLSYCVFFPLNGIYLFMIPLPIPAILYGVLFILISARLMGNPGNRIAHEGHLGGAVAGVLLTVLMRPEAVTRFFG